MKRASSIVVVIAVVVAFALGLGGRAVMAAPVHYGTNSLTFAAVGKNQSPSAKGRGEVEYDGGNDPRSRWSASFRFTGLTPDTAYSVQVLGRFGEDGSKDAAAYTELCSFTSERNGSGSCFAYFRGLMRLNVVQLQIAGTGGGPVMQATRSDSGPGSITTVPNRYTDPELRKAKAGSTDRGSRAGGTN
jgi:hypothetical protein